jgi:crossover junction endodeoxyribonuclease RusA
MMHFSFFVPGIPATAGSKNGFYNKKIGRVIMAPANKKQKPWMSHVQACALEVYNGPPIDGPIKLSIVFIMPRPKGHFGTGKYSSRVKENAPFYPTSKPDATKMLRAVEDALTGVVWKDDSQVVHIDVCKLYTSKDFRTPGAEIIITD